jgi:DNA-binding GntR family transcriptional regulator
MDARGPQWTTLSLADDITSGRLPPGAEVDEQSIGERFGASRTPVREALRQLASTGFVSLEPRRGARVAMLTVDRLSEMFEVMAETEALCAQLTTNRATGAERVALRALHERSRELVEGHQVHRYDEHNRDFRLAIYAGTHNAFLAEHAAGLRLRLSPFRRAQFGGKDRLRQSFEEHASLLAQMMRGDGEEASRVMRAHMLTAGSEYLSVSPQEPGAAASVRPRPP